MLFKVEKLKTEAPETADCGTRDGAEQLASVFFKIQSVLNLVDYGRTVHWVSEGDWSMHQLLQALLDKTGPADVWISSYAFSDLPARIIAELKRTGIIQKLFCVIDSRVDVRSASALTLLKNSADGLKLTHTHAKVTVIRNKSWFLVVCGSANYTTNKRYEAGLISTDAGVASFHQKWITNELHRGTTGSH